MYVPSVYGPQVSQNYNREQLTQLIQAAIARESFGVNPTMDWVDDHHCSIELDLPSVIANRIKADEGLGVDPTFCLSLLEGRKAPFLKYRLFRIPSFRAKWLRPGSESEGSVSSQTNGDSEAESI